MDRHRRRFTSSQRLLAHASTPDGVIQSVNDLLSRRVAQARFRSHASLVRSH
ncbi:hypothetical protein L579_2986 [Pantoea sp. AS-PWVM4]|nr:hypothetical protein L579_2986 [Pantoea sp. AS-PWVM4]